MRARMLVPILVLLLASLACLGQSAQDEEPLLDFPPMTTTSVLYQPTGASATATEAAPAAQPATPTEVAPTAPLPTPTSNIPPGEATRIRFGPGAIAATVEGEVAAGGADEYLLFALESQTMFVAITPMQADVFLSVSGLADGLPLVRAASEATDWTGTLPASQDYSIKAVSGGDATGYILEIVILPRGTAYSEDEPCLLSVSRDYTAYWQPSEDAEVFGTLSPDMSVYASARTPDDWIGFDPGVAQAGNVGLDRLRWVRPDEGDINYEESCAFMGG